MKTNKLIIGLLPLLLIATACKPAPKPSSSEEPAPSSESSGEEEKSSSPEAPVVPPEVREQEAKEELARLFGLVSNGDYTINLTSYWNNDASYYIADNLFIKEYPYSYYYDKDDYMASIGYLAAEDGVKALQRKNRRECEEFRMVGYAKKTNSLAESLQIVENLKIKLSFTSDDWTYKSNDGTVSEFTTTSLQMRNQYALLDNLEGSGDLYNSLTLRIYNNMDDFRLIPDIKDNELQVSGAVFSNFGKVKQLPELQDAFECATNWTEAKWYETSVSKKSKLKEIPFPTQGDKYYFVDNLNNAYKDGEASYFKVGFVNTGDIAASYIQQLLDDGYTLDPRYEGENSRYARALKYPTYEWEEPQDWSSSVTSANVHLSFDNSRAEYPQGIFYITFFTDTNFPKHTGYEWSDQEKNQVNRLQELPFPNQTPFMYYFLSGWNDSFGIEFYGVGEEFIDSYGAQLEEAGFTLDDENQHYYSKFIEEINFDEYTQTRTIRQFVIHLYLSENGVNLQGYEQQKEERVDNHDFTPYERSEYLYYANDLPFLADHSALKYYFNDTACQQFGITFEYVEEGDLDVYKQQLVDIGFEEREVEIDVFKYVRDLSDKYESDERGYIDPVETREERDEFDNVTVYETRSYLALALEALDYGDVPVLRVSAQIIRLETVVE